ncbi:MAG: 16S rRNA (uracil(1498)-N(3))-methyltransferase [Bacteroidales bacterium]|jgi:16S rRNA (uracil1498-N3)-methyltransferase|nr:16S rRNA (uracil(1498)-N(3))-methyltransferase [Bacteroidales bacterium]
MHLFLAHIETNHATLSEAESAHCSKVLRLSVGDKILVSDGQGTLCEAELTVVNPKSCDAEITNELGVFKRPYHLHVACAPTKNIDRFEWFLEKATEIGIDEITPIITEHSERTVVKLDRSERVIMAAMKQCQVPNLPTIYDLKKFADFLKTCTADQKFICYCGNEFEKQTLKNALYRHRLQVCASDVQTAGADLQSVPTILILIGPEGDFSQKEVALAVEQGFIPITLGETRLRTETAGIVAVHTVSLASQP